MKMAKPLFCLVLTAAIIVCGIGVPFSRIPDCRAGQAVPAVDDNGPQYAVHKVKRNETVASLARAYLGDERKGWIIRSFNRVDTLSPGMSVIIPLHYKRPGGLSAKGYQLVPVLVYHRFSDSCKTPLCISTDVFEQQMKYLHDNGYATIGLRDFMRFSRLEGTIPPKSVVITIDDGYGSTYDIAYPVLRKYGFVATLFVYTDFIEASGKSLTWKQLKEMKDAGFEVESHSKAHSDLTVRLNGESDEQYRERVKQEIEVPRELIKKNVGYESLFFAYPFGKSNDQVKEVLVEEKYEAGLNVDGEQDSFFAAPFSLSRIQVFNSYGLKEFAGLLKIFHEQDSQ